MTKPHVKALLTLFFMVICLLPLEAFAADQPAASGLRFTILHTNDLHAHDEPFVDRGRTIGGMAKIAHIIRAIKASNPNVLAIDAGDIFQGTSFFKFYHGQVEVEMLNSAGYDIYTIGNHEFDDGAINLAKQLKNARFDIISANMDAQAVPDLAALVKPSVVKTINGQKVAFIGGIVPSLNEVALKTDGVKLKATGEHWMEPFQQEITRLKSNGIDKIILVTHCGLEMDKQLATLPDVDAIIGGHSHTRLDAPVIVDHPDGSKCAIVQTGSYGRTLGKFDLAFDDKGQLDTNAMHYRLINITSRIPDEPDVKDYLVEKSQPFLAMRNTVLSQAEGDFDNSFKKYPWDSSIGNLVTDALVEQGSKYGATIGFQNRGGIRARIDAGPITEEKVDETLPFENHLMVATIPGETLLKTLELSVSGEFLGGRFLDVHGIKFAYDRTHPPQHRVLWALAQDKDGEWAPVAADRLYRIAMNDYSFKGGEGYDFSKATDVVDTGERLSKFFKEYLLQHKVVTPQQPNRIIPLNSEIATFETTGPKKFPQLLIKSNLAGAKVYLVRGTGKDICLLRGNAFPVPLKRPQLVFSTVIAPGQTEVVLPIPKAEGSKLEYVGIVVPKHHPDQALISAPLERP